MASDLEIRERQKNALGDLLEIKKANQGIEVKLLQELIVRAIRGMLSEDVALVEKLVGVKAL